MPTEALRLAATVDDLARAAMAEIERREGYEVQLLTAQENCRAPMALGAEDTSKVFRKGNASRADTGR